MSQGAGKCRIPSAMVRSCVRDSKLRISGGEARSPWWCARRSTAHPIMSASGCTAITHESVSAQKAGGVRAKSRSVRATLSARRTPQSLSASPLTSAGIGEDDDAGRCVAQFRAGRRSCGAYTMETADAGGRLAKRATANAPRGVVRAKGLRRHIRDWLHVGSTASLLGTGKSLSLFDDWGGPGPCAREDVIKVRQTLNGAVKPSPAVGKGTARPRPLHAERRSKGHHR